MPVGAAYRSAIGVFAEAAAGLAVGHRPAVEEGVQSSGEVLGDASPALASSGSRPSEKIARSRAATTYALNRGPQSWTSDGSSQVDGPVPSTRAWIESSAARGMLSCRPAHAACRRDAGPGGSRSSSAPTRRR